MKGVPFLGEMSGPRYNGLGSSGSRSNNPYVPYTLTTKSSFWCQTSALYFFGVNI